MATFKRSLVILNPSSGQHEVTNSQEMIEDVLSSKMIAFEVRLTQGAGDAADWAKNAAAEGFDVVIVAGGDGTIMAALNGLLKAKGLLPLIIVPLGTANGLARTLKLPLEPKAALEAALAGDIACFDVGYIINRDHYFLLFAGAGYDAQVIRDADREQKSKYGLMAYFYAAFKHLGKRRNQYLTLILDGKPMAVHAHSVLMFNVNDFVVAGVPLGPRVNANDGKLDIILLRDPSVWGMFRELWYILTHRLTRQSSSFLQASSLRIEALYPLPFQTDGDELGQTPLEIEVKQNAAQFVVPQAYLGSLSPSNS
jgi:diacylglycerol kinase (ATP)